MTRIQTNADEVAKRIQAKSDALAEAVRTGTTDALLAVEAAAVKNLSGSNAAEPWTYPVPARTGNLKNARTVKQEPTGVGIIAFLADYAWAIHSGKVNQWAGRGKTRRVQRIARPFADDAIKTAKPTDYIINAVEKALAA